MRPVDITRSVATPPASSGLRMLVLVGAALSAPAGGASSQPWAGGAVASDTPPGSRPGPKLPAAGGAWSTGMYRNLFKEAGLVSGPAESAARVESAFQQVFYGNCSAERDGPLDQRLFFWADPVQQVSPYFSIPFSHISTHAAHPKLLKVGRRRPRRTSSPSTPTTCAPKA